MVRYIIVSPVTTQCQFLMANPMQITSLPNGETEMKSSPATPLIKTTKYYQLNQTKPNRSQKMEIKCQALDKVQKSTKAKAVTQLTSGYK